MGLGISVALQAPTHRQLLLLPDLFHEIHPAVARHAGNPAVDVGRMVEIGIIRQVVNPNPADWLTAFPALPQRFEQRGILFDVSMAVHARLGGRDRSVGCIFHSVVEIATVDPKLTRMKCV